MATQIRNKDELSIAAIRSNCIDMINLAKSGHPGMALSSAPILYELFKDFLNVNPKDPNWINRDRIVYSSGHVTSLVYTLMHLVGFNISMNDLKKFRQLGSITPGHPEIQLTKGIDCNTGPLGQGIANAVGMAMAERYLRNLYGKEIYDHYTYCLCGDGCLQEGISEEAIQIAGFQQLDRLILLYDRNYVTLDGPLSQSFNGNVGLRFLANNWNVVNCPKGNNLSSIKRAIKKAKNFKNGKPTIVIFNTIMGFGSQKEGTNKTHGAPLGEDDGIFAKQRYGYFEEKFTIPEIVYNNIRNALHARLDPIYEAHQHALEDFKEKDPEKYEYFKQFNNGNFKQCIDKKPPLMNEKTEESTRAASQRILNMLYKKMPLPVFVGGSADVESSVMTKIADAQYMDANHPLGTSINWGIREFAMGAAANGMLLHGGLRTYCGSFLVFSDYMKNSIRMAAMMQIPQIFLFSHDSVAVGEDGPSHQPVEQILTLRSLPNIAVFRPCDAKETYACWRLAIESKKNPSAIIFSRQALPLLENTSNYELVKKGAYILEDCKGEPDCVLIACGSEVQLALETKPLLEEKGLKVRIVSMPCWELFDIQDEEYKESVLGKDYNKRVSLESESTIGWSKYAKFNYGNDKFGVSGKLKDVFNYFGFAKEDVATFILNKLK